MSVEIRNQYLFQCTDPASDLKSLGEELSKLVQISSVKSEAKTRGVSPEQLQHIKFEFNLDEQPALSPEEIATLAITIVVLEPAGRVVEAALLDIWKQVLLPRLLDWIDSKGWELRAKD